MKRAEEGAPISTVIGVRKPRRSGVETLIRPGTVGRQHLELGLSETSIMTTLCCAFLRDFWGFV
jgi:hypothetical protein